MKTTLKELEDRISELLQYNGLVLELKNEFDLLYNENKNYTDTEIRVLLLNKLLQRVLDSRLTIEESNKILEENEYYKKTCMELLDMIEKDSDLIDNLKMKITSK